MIEREKSVQRADTRQAGVCFQTGRAAGSRRKGMVGGGQLARFMCLTRLLPDSIEWIEPLAYPRETRPQPPASDPTDPTDI